MGDRLFRDTGTFYLWAFCLTTTFEPSPSQQFCTYMNVLISPHNFQQNFVKNTHFLFERFFLSKITKYSSIASADDSLWHQGSISSPSCLHRVNLSQQRALFCR